jgi:hypothetical protein
MKKFTLTLLFALVTVYASASFKVGDIYYQPDEQADDGTCWVCAHPNWGGYEGLTDITIPGRVTYNGRTYRVTAIINDAFKNVGSLERVRIGWGVEEILSNAFAGCTNLKYVYLPSSIKLISNYAFQSCTSMIRFGIAASTPPTLGTSPFLYMKKCEIVTALRSSTSDYNAISTWTNADSDGSVTYNGAYANDFDSSGRCYIINGSISSDNNDAVLVGLASGVTYLPISSSVTDYTNQTYGNGSSYSCSFKEIAPYAAYNHSTLQKIGRSDMGSYFRLTKVGDNAFYNCQALTEVNISAREIGNYAFYKCSNLATVNLYLYGNENYGTVSLGSFCFAYTGVTTQYIPQTLTSYGNGAFAWCSNLTRFNVSSSNTSFATDSNTPNCLYSSSKSTLYQMGAGTNPIPGALSTYMPNALTTINPYSMAGAKLVTVDIPYGVTSIYGYAFSGMPNVQTIRIPSSVSTIFSTTFGGLSTTTLRHVYINLKTIPSNMQVTSSFSSLTTGVTLHVPKWRTSYYTSGSWWSGGWGNKFTGGVVEDSYDFTYDKVASGNYVDYILYYTVSSNASYTDTKVQSAAVDGQLTVVGGYIGASGYFNGTLTFPSTTTHRGKTYITTEVQREVFRDQTRITKVTGGSGIKKIGALSFAGLTGCTQGFNIPNPVEFGDSSLFNCWTPTITLGDRLERIGNDAFRQSAVRQVLMPPSVTTIGARIVAGVHQLDTIRLSPNITEIPTCGLGWCSARWIVIPYGVKKIGSQAFFSDNYGGGLDEPMRENVVVIPSSVTTIASDAFALARHLDAIFLNVPYGVFTSSKGDWFRRLDLDASNPYDWSGHKLYVPAGQLEQYRNDPGIRQCWRSGDIQCGAFDFTTDNNFWGTMYRMTVVDATNRKAKYVYNWGTNSTSVYVSNTKTDHNSGISYTMVEIGDSCWVNRPGVTSVSFPTTSNITRIGAYAFKDCTGITGEISVPATVSEIGTYAFWNCSSLTSVFLNRTERTTIGKNMFYPSCNNILYVPIKQLYDISNQAYSWWSNRITGQNLLPYIKPTAEWTTVSVPFYNDILLPSSGEFYIAPGYNNTSHTLLLSKLTNSQGVKGYEGMLFKGTEGTVYRFRKTSSVSNYSYVSPETNLLKGAHGAYETSGYETYAWYFVQSVHKFRKWTDPSSAMKTYSGDAYLQLSYALTNNYTGDISIGDDVDYYYITIAGVSVTSLNCDDLSVIDGVSGTINYNPSTKILTLRNVTINSNDASAISSANTGLTIRVLGTNTLNCGQSNTAALSLTSTTITGGGTLNCYHNNGFYGMSVSKPVSISGGVKLNATGSYGISHSTNGTITVSGASTKITAKGTTASYSCPTTLNDGLAITEPAGAYFNSSGTVVSSSGTVVKNQYVVISKPTVTRGDVNGDGSVNIADVTKLIDYLLSSNATGVDLSASDCNQDGSVNISDVTKLIDYLLGGSW